MNHRECLDAYVDYMKAYGVEAFVVAKPDHTCQWYRLQHCPRHEMELWGHPTDAQFETWRSAGHEAEHVVL